MRQEKAKKKKGIYRHRMPKREKEPGNRPDRSEWLPFINFL